MMAARPSIRNSASGMGACPMMRMLMYSQYVPTENVPKLNQKPSTAARRGVAPCHSHISNAGHNMANGHHSNGANESPSDAPATNATLLPAKRRSMISRGFTLRPTGGLREE